MTPQKPTPTIDRLRHIAARGWAARRWLALACLALALFLPMAIAVARCRLIDPPASTILLDRHGAFLAQLAGETPGDYGYWPLDHVPPRVAAATLMIEDRHFADYPGLDPAAVARALVNNWRGTGRRSGASTIAMQLARLQNPEPRNYFTKAIEAMTAVLLTAHYGHDAVLRQYLRLAPYGQGSHGIAHAARWYFDKPLDDLSWGEIAFLIAIPQAPGLMNPDTDSGHKRIQTRARFILKTLADEKVIRKEDEAAGEDEIDSIGVIRRKRPEDCLHAILRIDSMLHAGLITLPRQDDRIIRAELDMPLQELVTKNARAALADWRDQGAEQAAVLIADRKSREVLAAFGSADYFLPPAGAIDFTRRYRSPGSALKPFIYALGLDQGAITPDSVLEDIPDRKWGIHNADNSYMGAMLPAQALANSRNIPAASLVDRIGAEPTLAMFRDLGLTQSPHAASYYGLVMAIGAVPTRLDKLVTAYGALANDGMFEDLVWAVNQKSAPARAILSPDSARQISLFLSDPMTRLPSFPRMGTTEYRFPVAIKTGTSQAYRDAWTVAYSERYIIGVWVGRLDAGPMEDVSGGHSAAKLAQTLLGLLQPDEAQGNADISFPTPVNDHLLTVCINTMEVNSAQCPQHIQQRLPPLLRKAALPPEEDTPVRLHIVSPANKVRLIRNPEQPAKLNWIALKARLSGTDGQIVWSVDGLPFKVAAVGDTVHWQMAPGTHHIEAQLAFGTQKDSVTIKVQ